jgi:hypothetical protein
MEEEEFNHSPDPEISTYKAPRKVIRGKKKNLKMSGLKNLLR